MFSPLKSLTKLVFQEDGPYLSYLSIPWPLPCTSHLHRHTMVLIWCWTNTSRVYISKLLLSNIRCLGAEHIFTYSYHILSHHIAKKVYISSGWQVFFKKLALPCEKLWVGLLYSRQRKPLFYTGTNITSDYIRQKPILISQEGSFKL